MRGTLVKKIRRLASSLSEPDKAYNKNIKTGQIFARGTRKDYQEVKRLFKKKMLTEHMVAQIRAS